jgi:glycosyltransferase involved in cell wall biosynthesis
MLVTDVGGLREIVPDGKCGYVVKPDPKEISDSIIDYFTNDRKKLFTENVRKEKVKYSWSKMTASFTEVFNKCVNNDNKK